MPWWLITSFVLIPPVIFRFAKTPRERRREFVQRFLRGEFWWILVVYVVIWVWHSFLRSWHPY